MGVVDKQSYDLYLKGRARRFLVGLFFNKLSTRDRARKIIWFLKKEFEKFYPRIRFVIYVDKEVDWLEGGVFYGVVGNDFRIVLEFRINFQKLYEYLNDISDEINELLENMSYEEAVENADYSVIENQMLSFITHEKQHIKQYMKKPDGIDIVDYYLNEWEIDAYSTNFAYDIFKMLMENEKDITVKTIRNLKNGFNRLMNFSPRQLAIILGSKHFDYSSVLLKEFMKICYEDEIKCKEFRKRYFKAISKKFNEIVDNLFIIEKYTTDYLDEQIFNFLENADRYGYKLNVDIENIETPSDYLTVEDIESIYTDQWFRLTPYEIKELTKEREDDLLKIIINRLIENKIIS